MCIFEMMKTWVVTGGVGSGKSVFCRMLLELELAAVLFSSDEIVHELLGREAVARQVVQIFDATVLDNSGSINRAALREKAFASARGRQKLEALIHPLVYQRLEEERLAASAKGTQLFIAEIPLFYETQSKFQADLIILVAASDGFQRRRLMEQRGLDAGAIQLLVSAQLPLERKLALAQTVVWNEGSLELLQSQAQHLLQQLY